MTDTYEFSEYNRTNLIYNYSSLSHEEASQKVINFQKFEEEKKAAKAAADAAAAEAKAKAKEGEAK